MNSNMKKRLLGKGMPLLVLCLLLAVGLGVGDTLAYLKDNSGPVRNVFTPSEVKGELNEEFSGEVKSSITVKNTGNIPAYIRVMLAPYWVDKDGAPVAWLGGWDVSFTLGENWVKGNDGYYYYTKPVPVGELTSDLLGSSVTLTVDSGTGYRQALDVFAECIQTEPAQTLIDAGWGWKP